MKFVKFDRYSLEQSKRIIENIYSDYHERCGVIVGRISGETAIIEETIEIENISNTPETTFVFNPKDYYEACILKRTMLGIWHTHPDYPGYPSKYDRVSANNGYVPIGGYLIYTSHGPELYPYYWDGKLFICV